MKRVFVLCEGPTELTFVREILQPEFPVLHLIAILPGKTYAKRQSGGNIKYARAKPDILNALKMDPQCFCTTMFDYYGLGDDFPSQEEPRGESPEDKAARIERAVNREVAKKLGPSFNPTRFRCYLSMHEFEGLLFSDPTQLALGLGRAEIEEDLRAERASVATPEHLNNDPENAPSKRLRRICPVYDKVVGGNVAALSVGIGAMKRECAHFHQWLEWFKRLQ
jgi:hypothetical protein